MAEGNLERPLSPYEREQERLRREAEERQKEEAARAEHFEAVRGEEFAKLAEIRGVQDPETQKAVAAEMAKMLAKEGAPQNFDWENHRQVPEAAIGKVLEAEALARQQEQEKAKQAAQPQQPAQESETPIGTAETNTPERHNRQIGRYDELKRLSEQQTKEAAPAPIIAAWRATAHEVCDPKIPPSGGSSSASPPPNSPEPPPPNGPSGQRLPLPPTPPTPPANPNQPLNANEVLQRFNDPALQARYQQDQQQRNQDTKSSLYSADTATRSSAARASTLPDGSRDTGLMADFVKTETKQKAAAEEAARAAEAARNLQRSGGRGR